MPIGAGQASVGDLVVHLIGNNAQLLASLKASEAAVRASSTRMQAGMAGLAAANTQVAKTSAAAASGTKQLQTAQVAATVPTQKHSQSIRGLVANYKLLAAVAAGVVINSTTKTTLAFEAAERKLFAATGTAEGARKEMALLRQEAERLGRSQLQLANGFANFAAAAKGTSLEGAKAREIFAGINETATVLQMDQARYNLTMMAFTQILSKGVVSMEELRRQLSEHIPGSLSIAARAMGLTTAEFLKQIEAGKILSEDFLPKFAKELQNTFGPALDEALTSRAAKLGRFNNKLIELKKLAGDLILEVFMPIVEGLTAVLTKTDDLTQGTVQLSKEWEVFGKIIGGTLLVGLVAITEIFHGWRLLIKSLQLAFAFLTEIFAKGVLSIAKGAKFIADKVLGGLESALNNAINGINSLLDSLPDWMKPEGLGTINTVDFKLNMDLGNLEDASGILEQTRKSFQSELAAMSNEKSPSQAIFEQVLGANKRVNVPAPVGDGTVSAVDGRAAAQSSLNAILGENGSNLPGAPGGNLTPVFPIDPILQQLQEEKEIVAKHIEELEALEVSGYEDIQKQKEDALKQFTAKQRQIQLEQMQAAVQSLSQISEAGLSIMEDLAGRQSGIYKGMFAANKAFAIAMATVNIAKAISDGFAQGTSVYEKLAAVAIIAAQTASIVSNIKAVQMEFGGERAMGGRVGRDQSFLVGERGPELFRPTQAGSIIPNDTLMGGRGGMKQEVHIHNYNGSKISSKESPDGSRLDIMIEQLDSALASRFDKGQGQFQKVLTNAGLSRGRGSGSS